MFIGQLALIKGFELAGEGIEWAAYMDQGGCLAGGGVDGPLGWQVGLQQGQTDCRRLLGQQGAEPLTCTNESSLRKPP